MLKDNNEDGETPDYISTETFVLAKAVNLIGEHLELDLGPALKNPRNGDTIWFILTDDLEYNVYVVIISPYVIFIETVHTAEDESITVDYAIVESIKDYLEHLKGLGARKLNDEEMKFFFNGD